MNILRAISDPQVFGPAFRKRDTWSAWFVFLAALFGLPLTPEQLVIYRECTGRIEPPSGALSEAWLVVGRRGGKSFILALIAVFLACFKDWRPFLGPGEVGTIMIVAQDRKQARTILRFVKGLLRAVPMLKRLIVAETAEAVELSNHIVIEVHSCSYRSVRGYTCVAVLLDEIAVWRGEDAANPDLEVIAAVKPTMVTVPGAMLLCASSPQGRKGALWESYRKHFGKNGEPVLVWQAPTRTMNPLVPQSDVDAALEADPARNRAEYLAQFRTDIEGFVTREAVEACIDFGVRERPPVQGVRYTGFVDPSGGSVDSFTLAIAHSTNGTAVLDALREARAPFSPSAVVEEFAAVLKSYRITSVRGDQYAKEWPVEAFAKFDIKYEPAGKFKSDIYLAILPLINSGKVRLLDHTRMINQLLDLDRVTARGGRESIDHPRDAHDDLCNAAAGALLFATAKKPELRTGAIGVDGRIFWHDEEPRQHSRLFVNGREIPPQPWGAS